jgi:hypothetical protein
MCQFKNGRHKSIRSVTMIELLLRAGLGLGQAPTSRPRAPAWRTNKLLLLAFWLLADTHTHTLRSGATRGHTLAIAAIVGSSAPH